MRLIFKLFIHLSLFVFLTVFTQIGGVVYLFIALFYNPKLQSKRRKFVAFLGMYLVFSLAIVPLVAPRFGRVALPMTKSGDIVPHTYLTVLLNRNYVTPKMLRELATVSDQFTQRYPDSKISYLDANFPFWDGFPLLPHRSHDDGRKIDISFFYNKNGKPTNKKPSNLGYGYYENPVNPKHDKVAACKNAGHWQYDFAKYLTLGSRKNFTLDDERTKALTNILLGRKSTHMIFIEPHLVHKLDVVHPKMRFHGCKAVRHDDHLHWQVFK